MTQPRRVALVTGGAIGIGRAIVHRLAADGIAVAVGHHRAPADVVDEVRAAGGVAAPVAVDVTDPAAVEAAFATTVAELGRVDIVINNAGGLLARVPIETMSDAHWEAVVTLNLTSVFTCTRAALAHLGPGGRIVNIVSLAAQDGGGAGSSAYAAAKAGVVGFTRASAKELGGRGITVNAIAPGFIDETPFHATFSTAAARAAAVQRTVVGRAGTPADIADAVAWLVAPGSGFVTGTVIDLNGGAHFT